jgi:N6-L-threonylcarbamoyladenine synthase
MATILAIESSCDETAVAIIKDGTLLCNVVSSQIEVHQKYGGVMPEIASRLHLENIGAVLDEALAKSNIKLEEVDAFAVTRGPGLIGALHVGLQAAKTLALVYNKPLIPVHHLAGHIYANEYITNFVFPMLAVVVSGGNTELVLMKDQLEFEIIGETQDDAIGECFDKVARVIGLPYPGGVAIDKHAKTGKHIYAFKTPHVQEKYDFSYSGLKTSVINFVNSCDMKSIPYNIDDIAKSFQDVAVDVVVEKAYMAAKEYNVKMVCLAGGVSANSYLREQFSEKFQNEPIQLVIPPLWCTTDNAAMIAKVATHLYDKKVFADLSLGVDPNWRIEDYLKF